MVQVTSISRLQCVKRSRVFDASFALLLLFLAGVSMSVAQDWVRGPSSTPPFIHLQKNVSSSNATAWLSTPFNFSVSANTNYTIDCVLLGSSTAGATGVQLNMSVPNYPLWFMLAMNNPTTTVAPLYSSCGQMNSSCSNLGLAAAQNPIPITLKGRLINGVNAGRFDIRLRSEIGGNNATLEVGSYCRVSNE